MANFVNLVYGWPLLKWGEHFQKNGFNFYQVSLQQASTLRVNNALVQKMNFYENTRMFRNIFHVKGKGLKKENYSFS